MTLYQMYKNLEKCVDYLEEDVKKSLIELDGHVSENVMALESTKNYHYNEILGQLKQIKERIKIIENHDRSIQSLQNKIIRDKRISPIDKDYIKKQVESFQRLGQVNRRERKSLRAPETSSMKLLEAWEKILDDEKAAAGVVKREGSTRKKKKVISSTIETFLESPNGGSVLESLDEVDVTIPEAINDELIVDSRTSTKPRIVDVIYKKDVSGEI